MEQIGLFEVTFSQWKLIKWYALFATYSVYINLKLSFFFFLSLTYLFLFFEIVQGSGFFILDKSFTKISCLAIINSCLN